MTIRKGQPLKLGATDVDDTRYDYKNHVVTNSDGTPRGGVTGPVGVNIVTASATMNVSVAAFSAMAIRDAGVVLLANDGPTNVLLTAAPASNSRIDVIYAKQNDASATVTTPDANNTPLLDKVTGTASASPAKPAIPTGAVELATVLIPSTATASNSAGVVITQTAPYTASPGGTVPFRTLALLNAWTTAPTLQNASVFADTTAANNGAYVWSGTAWVKSQANTIIFDTSGDALAGTEPPAGAPMITQICDKPFVVGGGSGITWTFPQAFPNGLCVAFLINADQAATPGAYFVLGSCTKTALTAAALQANGTGISSGSNIRANIIAVGW